MNLQSVLDKYGVKCKLSELLEYWNEPHRGFHTTKHLYDLIEQIKNRSDISEKQKEQLALIALFHDIVYDPMRNDNEEQSVELFYKYIDYTNDNIHDIHIIADCILDTKTHEPRSAISSIFSKMDMNIVLQPFIILLEWESGIAKEYSFLPRIEYVEKRCAFLEKMVHQYPQNAHNLKNLILHIQSK